MVNTCIGRYGEAAIVYEFAISTAPSSEYLTTHVGKKRGPKASSVCHILKHYAAASSRLSRYRYLRGVPTKHTDSVRSTPVQCTYHHFLLTRCRIAPIAMRNADQGDQHLRRLFDRLRQMRENQMRLTKRILAFASVAARRPGDPYTVLDRNSYKVVVIRIDD